MLSFSRFPSSSDSRNVFTDEKPVAILNFHDRKKILGKYAKFDSFFFSSIVAEHHKVEKENYHIMLLNYSHEAAAVDIDAHGSYRI